MPSQPGSTRLPPSGAVLGIDVGYSTRRRSSAVCRLHWDRCRVDWVIRRFRASHSERSETIAAVGGTAPLQGAAFDGPLRTGFDLIDKYRTAERMLTRRLQSKISKPGQSNSRVGRNLNDAANTCVQATLMNCKIGTAVHHVAIDAAAIVEAFPSSFLGLMIEDPLGLSVKRSDRSDLFFQHLATSGTLTRLLAHLLPGRAPVSAWSDVTNHDDRAALVCALTALAVAADDYTAVGDADGWIILPPSAFVQPWAKADLEHNARDEPPGSWHVSRPEP